MCSASTPRTSSTPAGRSVARRRRRELEEQGVQRYDLTRRRCRLPQPAGSDSVSRGGYLPEDGRSTSRESGRSRSASRSRSTTDASSGGPKGDAPRITTSCSGRREAGRDQRRDARAPHDVQGHADRRRRDRPAGGREEGLLSTVLPVLKIVVQVQVHRTETPRRCRRRPAECPRRVAGRDALPRASPAPVTSP